MIHTALVLTALIGLSSLMNFASAGAPESTFAGNPVVVLDTTAGPITIELDAEKAPISTENFLKYVDKGFYDGVVFHRVIADPNSLRMVQTGGMTETGDVLTEKRKEAMAPIKNESGKGLSNVRGTIAMARTSLPDSATSQFFINFGDNSFLDSAGGGYAVFGKVTSGIENVDTIAKSKTTSKRDSLGGRHDNVPTMPIVIKSAKRKTGP